MEKLTLCKIRSCLSNNIGNKVKVTVKKSRNKTYILDGFIENAHPSVFTVQIGHEIGKGYQTRVSYSYSDLLTKSVELVIFGNNARSNYSEISTHSEMIV